MRFSASRLCPEPAARLASAQPAPGRPSWTMPTARKPILAGRLSPEPGREGCTRASPNHFPPFALAVNRGRDAIPDQPPRKHFKPHPAAPRTSGSRRETTRQRAGARMQPDPTAWGLHAPACNRHVPHARCAMACAFDLMPPFWPASPTSRPAAGSTSPSAIFYNPQVVERRLLRRPSCAGGGGDALAPACSRTQACARMIMGNHGCPSSSARPVAETMMRMYYFERAARTHNSWRWQDRPPPAASCRPRWPN